MGDYLYENGTTNFSRPGNILDVNDIQAAKMCEKNLGLIRGRVLVQTLPTHAYDVEATLEHARLYDREFQKLGISRDRFCIKILATGPGVTAAAILQQEGIQTLGTGVFSVAQAIACSQAGCLYISPYYNGGNSFLSLPYFPPAHPAQCG